MFEHEQDPDFSEDDAILEQLVDPVDIEAFQNLMEHAHKMGKSAAWFVREEPQRTSRKAIKDLCLKLEKKGFIKRIGDLFKGQKTTLRDQSER